MLNSELLENKKGDFVWSITTDNQEELFQELEDIFKGEDGGIEIEKPHYVIFNGIEIIAWHTNRSNIYLGMLTPEGFEAMRFNKKHELVYRSGIELNLKKLIKACVNMNKGYNVYKDRYVCNKEKFQLLNK